MFKKNLSTVAPWQKKGRWYHLFIESDGSAIHVTQSDIDNITFASNFIYYPQNFVPVSYAMLDNDCLAGTNVQFSFIRTGNNGLRVFGLPPVSNFTYVDMYVFGFFTEPAQTIATQSLQTQARATQSVLSADLVSDDATIDVDAIKTTTTRKSKTTTTATTESEG